MSKCRVFSCVERGCLLWPVHSLGKSWFILPCFIPYSMAKSACYSKWFLTSYICIPVPYNENDIFCIVFLCSCHLFLISSASVRVFPRVCTGHSKHLLPPAQKKTLYMDIIRWSIRKSDWLYSLQPKMEKPYTVSKNKTGNSDHELFIAKFRIKF